MLITALLAPLVLLHAFFAGLSPASAAVQRVVPPTAELQLADALQGVLEQKELTVEDLCRRVSIASAPDDDDLGFELHRLTVFANRGDLRASVRTLAGPAPLQGERPIAELRVELSYPDREPHARFERIAARISVRAREHDSRLRFDWRDDELARSLRRPLEKELGVVVQADVPAELRDALDTLASPLDALQLGRRCGFVGLPARGSLEMQQLLDAGRVDLLRIALRGANPEGRGWAAHALLLRERRGDKLAPEDALTIGALLASALEVTTCDGCILERMRLRPALEKLAR